MGWFHDKIWNKEDFTRNWNNSAIGSFFNGIGKFIKSISNPENLSSVVNTLTHAGLTGEQEALNQFSHDEAALAFQRELDASNTAMQRKVADYQAAGVNPMLAAGSGVQLPSASSAAATSPYGNGNLSSLMSVIGDLTMLPLQKEALRKNIKLTEANIGKVGAETGKIASETKGIDILNNFREESEILRLEGQRISNTLDSEKIKQIWSEIRNYEASTKKMIEEAKTEDSKRMALASQRLLDNASANRIAQLLPYEKVLMSAQTENQQAAAAFAAAQAAYQNGLLDNGYIEAVVKEANARASEGEARADVAEVHSWFAGSRYPEDLTPAKKFVMDMLIKPVGSLVNHFSPLSGFGVK